MDMRVKVWLAMRQLVRFDVATLVMTTEETQRSIADFLYRIARAGYARKQRVATGAGIQGCKFVWHLVRDTGPLPPLTRRNGQVYDQNQKKCYAPGGAVVACEGESDAKAP